MAATIAEACGDTVLISTNVVLADAVLTRPASPDTTSARISSFGIVANRRSNRLANSAGLAALRAPRACKAATRAASMSNTVTSTPAASRTPTMAPPMLPMPIQPTASFICETRSSAVVLVMAIRSGLALERECNHGVTDRRWKNVVAARGQHDVLGAADRISHRRRHAGGREPGRPQNFARFHVEDAELPVSSAGHEYQAARRHQRPAGKWGAHQQRRCQRLQILDCAERHCPPDLAGVQIHRGQFAPWWRGTGRAQG